MRSPVQGPQLRHSSARSYDLNHVTIRFPSVGLDEIEDLIGTVGGTAVDGAVHRFEGGDVFARAEMLPVAATGELPGVVSDGDAQIELWVDDADGDVAGAVG